LSLEKINKDFVSESCNENETLKIISEIYTNHNMILDPHTAVGVGTAKKLKFDNNCVVLATAHPCKFPDATNKAIKKNKELPEKLKSILNKEERFDIIEKNAEEVKDYIKKKLKL